MIFENKAFIRIAKLPSRLHLNDSLLHSEPLQTRYLRCVIEKGYGRRRKQGERRGK